MDKPFGAVLLGIDLHNRPQLAVGAKDKVRAGRRPAQAAIGTAAAFVEVVACARTPGRVHGEQVHEEIRAQQANTIGEDAMAAAPAVGSQDAQAPHENREFGCAQSQLLGPVQE